MTGTNPTFTGTTTIDTDATLIVNSASITGNIVDNGKLIFNQTANTPVYGGTITGTGPLTKQGAGTLTLTAANSYEGGTTITNGTLALSGAGRITGNMVVTSPGAFDMSLATPSGFTLTLGAVSGSGNINLGPNYLSTGSTESPLTYSGEMSGSGGLIERGSGTLILTNTNQYTGETEITGGELTLGETNAITTSDEVSISSGGTLQLTTFNNTISHLTGPAGASIVIGTGTSTPILTINQMVSDTFGGIISGPGSLVLNSIPPATLTLTGINTYAGPTSVLSGTLALSGAGRISGDVLVNSPGIFDISAVTPLRQRLPSAT